MDQENNRVIIDGNRIIYCNGIRRNLNRKPFFSITTPVYNRTGTIRRTIASVEKQTFRDFEYLIVDDGSTDELDPIVFEFIERADIPVTYVKKPNGGVHTARNLAIDMAVGEYIIFLDSDDELLPDACKIFRREWLSIPEEKRGSFFQVKALCVDENGEIQGIPFPDNINSLPPKKARPYFSMKGEKIGCRALSIMKKRKFPEPEGVKFLFESNLWSVLEKDYCSWGTNEVVRVYHKEGDDHLSKRGKKKTDLQFYKDDFWMRYYRLNHPRYFKFSLKERMWNVRRYYSFYIILKPQDAAFVERYRLTGLINNAMLTIRKISHNIHAFLHAILKR